MDVLAQRLAHEVGVLEVVECLGKAAGQRLDAMAAQLGVAQAGERAGRLLRQGESALDAVEARRQRHRVGEIGIGHGVGRTQLDTA